MFSFLIPVQRVSAKDIFPQLFKQEIINRSDLLLSGSILFIIPEVLL